MGNKVPWKIGMLIYLPVTSRRLIVLQEGVVLSLCNFATAHLTACILKFYHPLTLRPMKRRTLVQRPNEVQKTTFAPECPVRRPVYSALSEPDPRTPHCHCIMHMRVPGSRTWVPPPAAPNVPSPPPSQWQEGAKGMGGDAPGLRAAGKCGDVHMD